MKSAKPKRAGPQRRASRRAGGKAAAARPESVKAALETATEGAPASETAASPEQEPSEAPRAAVSGAVEVAGGLTRTAFDAWTESGTIVAKGMEDIGKAWLRYTQQSMEDGVAAARALLAARSLREAVDLQSDYARNSLGSLATESVRLSELSVKVAREAMQPLKTRLDDAVAWTS